MEDFGLEREHREFRDQFRRFVAAKIAPLAEAGEREHRFPREVYRVLRDGGFLAVNFPEAVGGGGGDLLTGCIFYEELTRASAGVSAGVFAHQHLAAGPVFRIGTEEQQGEFLLPALRGERIGAFGLTEPGAGSDARGIRTTATRDGDGWVINGTKMFITNAGTDMSLGVTLLAVSGTRPSGEREYSAFLVERGTPGFNVGRRIPKIGWHAVDTRELIFEGCRIPADHLIGQQGVGLRQFMKALAIGRISVAALSLGCGAACLDLALDYAKQRRQFDQPISHFQGIQFKLADMAVAVENSRLITYKAAWLYDQGREFAKEAAMAKLYASDTAMHVASEAVQVHGGYGYTTEYHVERYWRDLRVFRIAPVTQEMTLNYIAEHVLRLPKSYGA
ncbi:MAG TPA: acyl-CoA dehydrogenase [Candidatus Rokubacteria bacterium]|nr:acyl-CoA dehydrogenase [Candidatus Rokubacteria bacterium]